MRRCKLISPTNLMLEHPILGPVKEAEFLLVGVKEYAVKRREILMCGALAGAAFVVLIESILVAVVPR
jgi:hypothetical protein